MPKPRDVTAGTTLPGGNVTGGNNTPGRTRDDRGSAPATRPDGTPVGAVLGFTNNHSPTNAIAVANTTRRSIRIRIKGTKIT